MKTSQRLLLLLFFFVPTSAWSQDAHLWDSQYGTRAQLLGGLVVGAPSDLSSTFYNPAWLALEKQPGVLLTTKAFEAYQIKFKNGFGRGTEPSSQKVTPSPGFLGGKFTNNINGNKVAIAYSYLQRVKFEYDASGVRVDENSAPPLEGNAWFSGEAFQRSYVSEHWAGVTFAKAIGENIYLGVTPFGALRSQSRRSQVMAKGMDDQENFAHYYLMNHTTFWHTRLLVKVGLAFDYSPLTFGFTITSPSIGLFGSGMTHSDESLSGVDALPPEGTKDTFLAVNYQPDLSPTYRSPLSMAAGIAYRFGKTGLYFSSEWFNSMDSFDVLSPKSYPSQSHPDRVLMYDISYASRSILNWGLAVNHQFNRKFALYASFWADKSILDQDEEPTMMMATWDLWHTSLGASFEFLEIEFTGGLSFSWGSDNTDKFRSFNQDEQGDVLGDFPEIEIDFQRLKFLIGFNLPFGRG